MAVKKINNGLTYITDCEISALYRGVPSAFGSFKLDIFYKKTKDDIGREYKSINIDQSKFEEEIIQLIDDKNDKERIVLTDGMTDIDIFKTNKYEIHYSLIPGHTEIYIFNKKEFEKLKNWIKIDKEEKEKHQYTEEDVKAAYKEGRKNGANKTDKNFNDFIENLKSQK